MTTLTIEEEEQSQRDDKRNESFKTMSNSDATSTSLSGVPPKPPPLLPMSPSLKLRPLPPPRRRQESVDSEIELERKQPQNQQSQQIQQIAVKNTNKSKIPLLVEGVELIPRPKVPPPLAPISGDGGGDRERRRKEREERKKEREREAAEEQLKQLESDARRFFIYGFFALPLLWIVSILYFRAEHKDENASPIIKDYYKKSRLMLIIYTIIFTTWFILFQVFSDDLSAINVRSLNASSPTDLQ